jgi:hypothetical protein
MLYVSKAGTNALWDEAGSMEEKARESKIEATLKRQFIKVFQIINESTQ